MDSNKIARTEEIINRTVEGFEDRRVKRLGRNLNNVTTQLELQTSQIASLSATLENERLHNQELLLEVESLERKNSYLRRKIAALESDLEEMSYGNIEE